MKKISNKMSSLAWDILYTIKTTLFFNMYLNKTIIVNMLIANNTPMDHILILNFGEI